MPQKACHHPRAAPVEQKRVILALDGLQPDVGHEVLWVLRDALSDEILLVCSLLSATQQDLATLLTEVREALEVPVAAVVSDGQQSIRKAVAQVFPDVPHQLCHFHYLREATTPVFEADRHAKKELKKRVRGIRPIERAVEQRDDPDANLVRGYAVAVRSALTDDGLAPVDAPGLRLRERLTQIQASLQRIEEKGHQRRTPTHEAGVGWRPDGDGGHLGADPAGLPVATGRGACAGQ